MWDRRFKTSTRTKINLYESRKRSYFIHRNSYDPVGRKIYDSYMMCAYKFKYMIQKIFQILFYQFIQNYKKKYFSLFIFLNIVRIFYERRTSRILLNTVRKKYI